MTRYAFLAALLIVFDARTLPAQRGRDLTPDLGLALLVEVQSTALDSEGQRDTTLAAAGTVVGVRNDTVYVVTSYHHVRDAAWVHVRLTSTGPTLPAQVLDIDPKLDFAVLAVAEYASDLAWTIPTRAARVTAEPELREVVFAIGCPDGQCWVPPERGVLSDTIKHNLRVRSLYIREGNSGGPVVDAHGALLGIVTSLGTAEGTAVRWDTIDLALQQMGYPVNLPEKRGLLVGEGAMRIFGATFPFAARGVDGGRLPSSIRGEFAYRPLPGIEIAAGFTAVSFNATPLTNPGADNEEAYSVVYLFAGARTSQTVTRWALGRGLPDVISGGLDLLLPFGKARAVRMVPGDSVDLAHGEYVQARAEVEIDAGLSFAARGSYRIALGDIVGVSIAPTLYLVPLDHGRVFAYHPVLEIGADLRMTP